MNISKMLDYSRPRDGATKIAGWGDAHLIKKLNGKFELRGGTDAERAEARAWCSLFMRDALPVCTPAPRRHPQPSRE